VYTAPKPRRTASTNESSWHQKRTASTNESSWHQKEQHLPMSLHGTKKEQHLPMSLHGTKKVQHYNIKHVFSSSFNKSSYVLHEISCGYLSPGSTV
jgi:hypothetical protein